MMDRSKEYVRMCREAKEIQESWVAEVGDYWTYGDAGSAISIMCPDECFGVKKEEGQIWLPRQDQLLDRVKEYDDGSGTVPLLVMLEDFCGEILNYGDASCGLEEYYASFQSMEQLWLAFVMKTKYGKIWICEDWVEKNERAKI